MEKRLQLLLVKLSDQISKLTDIMLLNS